MRMSFEKKKYIFIQHFKRNVYEKVDEVEKTENRKQNINNN